MKNSKSENKASSPNYYAIIPAAVRYDGNLCPNAKLLYGEISALTNQEGHCWASNGHFAKLYAVTNRTITNWISELVNGGHIICEQNEGDFRHIFLANGGKKLSGGGRRNVLEDMEKKFQGGVEKKFHHNTTAVIIQHNTTAELTTENQVEHNTINNIQPSEQTDVTFSFADEEKEEIVLHEPITSDINNAMPEMGHSPMLSSTNGKSQITNQESQLKNNTQSQYPSKQTAVSHSIEKKAVHHTKINAKEEAVLELEDMHPEIEVESRRVMVDEYVSFLLSKGKTPTTNPKWIAENAFNMHQKRKGKKAVSILSADKTVDYPTAKGQVIGFNEWFEKNAKERLNDEIKSMMTDYIVDGKTNINRIIDMCVCKAMELNDEEKRIKEGLMSLLNKNKSAVSVQEEIELPF